MIDLKALRENPARFIDGARKKGVSVDIDRLVALDASRRDLMSRQEHLRSEQKRLSKDTGPQLGQLMGKLKSAAGPEKAALEAEIESIKAAPAKLKDQIQALEQQIVAIEPELNEILLRVPLPPDSDVPVGTGSDGNVELRRWAPQGWDFTRTFEQNKGFKPRTHLELCEMHRLVDFPRGVKMAGSRSYVLTGDGLRLHLAVLRFAVDFMTETSTGSSPMSVPVLVREECMVGTGFFPAGREQAYQVERIPTAAAGTTSSSPAPARSASWASTRTRSSTSRTTAPASTSPLDLLPARGRRGGQGHGGPLPHPPVRQGRAGRHLQGRRGRKPPVAQDDDRLCRDDPPVGSAIPYRLLQCCTGDLGVKNADMVDIECWMPGRGEVGKDGVTTGDFGETHSASRLYDYQCRRLNMRYRAGGDKGQGATAFCYSLNNTVAASPRILIPILEMHQNADGSVNIPEPLRVYMNGQTKIG
jgi:seryl-tRNA synthetase